MIDKHESDAVLINYPSGGFGFFLYGVLTICTNQFCSRDTDIGMSPTGDSHQLSLSVQAWKPDETDFKFVVSDWATDIEKPHLLLIDLGITDGRIAPVRKRFPTNKIIRICIDPDGKSIIMQTCLHKAQRKTKQDFYSLKDWEQREEISLIYHHADSNPGYYLNNYEPINDDNILNIPVTWFFFNFQEILKRIEEFLQITIDKARALELHELFLEKNLTYAQALLWSKKIMNSLSSGSVIDVTGCNSIHDQGYINYCIEKHFNIKEIPPYTYRNWFKTTAEIHSMIQHIKNEEKSINNQ